VSDTVEDLRVGSLISYSGPLGGVMRTSVACVLTGVAFRVDSIRLVVRTVEEKRAYLVDPREAVIELLCPPIDPDDDPDPGADDADERMDLLSWGGAVAWGLLAAAGSMVVGVAFGLAAAVAIGAAAVGTAWLIVHDNHRWGQP
jgi:hypothetical protein